MSDYLALDPATRDEVTEPVKRKPLAHVLQTSPHCITVFRWHGTQLESKRYPNTPRNFARYLAMRDRIEETFAIPF